MKTSILSLFNKRFTHFLGVTVFSLSLVALAEMPQAHAQDASGTPYWDEFDFQGERVKLSLESVQKRSVFNELIAQPLELTVDTADSAITSADSAFDPSFSLASTRARSDNDVTNVRSTQDSLTAGVTQTFDTGTALTASQTYTETDAELSSGDFDGNGDTTSLTLTQPLLKDGWAIVNGLTRETAKYSRDAQEFTQVDTLATQYTNATTAYWNHWYSFQILDIALEQLEMAKKQEDLATKLSNAGLTAKVEVLRAKTGVVQRYDSIITAQTSIISTNNTLMRLIVDDPEDKSLVLVETDDAPDVMPPNLDREEIVDLALENSLTIDALEASLASSQLTVDAADWQLYPDLDLSTSYSFSEDVYKNDTARSEIANTSAWSVGLTLTVPLGFRETKEDYRQAINARSQAKYAVDSERLNVIKTVETAVNSVHQNYRRFLAAKNEVEVTEAIYEAEVKQFNRGEQTSTEVLNAAQLVATAKTKLALARSQYEISKSTIDYVVGDTYGIVREYMALPETSMQ